MFNIKTGESRTKKISRISCLILAAVMFFTMNISSAFAAWNEYPQKNYPKLISAKILSGQSTDLKVELMFSNNVAAINEGQHQHRPEMPGINKHNEEQFSMTDSKGEAVDITVTRHPDVAMQTDEAKFFYVNASGIDVNEHYTIHVTDEVYANMGNSLPVPYDVPLCVAEGSISIEAQGKLPDAEIEQPLKYVSSKPELNEKNVAVDSDLNIVFSHTVAHEAVFSYNCNYINLYKLTEDGDVKVETSFEQDPEGNSCMIIIKPIEKLDYSTEYRLEATTKIQAKNGNFLGNPVGVFFTTEKDPAEKDPDVPGGNGGNGGTVPEGPSPELADKVYFEDVTKSHWAVIDINYLSEKGIVSGRPDGTFGAGDSITRAEIVKILCNTFGIETGFDAADGSGASKGNSFTDTKDSWAKEYIDAAYAAGIVNGKDDTHFNPNGQVTREEMAAMIVRAGKLTAEGKSPAEFADASGISAWAKEAVDIASANGIIKGYEGNVFMPAGKITRAETCRMIVNLSKVAETVL